MGTEWIRQVNSPLTETWAAVEVTCLLVEEASRGTFLTVLAVVMAIRMPRAWVDDRLIARAAVEEPHLGEVVSFKLHLTY